jgi:hypothetical protein
MKCFSHYKATKIIAEKQYYSKSYFLKIKYTAKIKKIKPIR